MADFEYNITIVNVTDVNANAEHVYTDIAMWSQCVLSI